MRIGKGIGLCLVVVAPLLIYAVLMNRLRTRHFKTLAEAAKACDRWEQQGQQLRLDHPGSDSSRQQRTTVMAYDRQCSYSSTQHAYIGLMLKAPGAAADISSLIESGTKALVFQADSTQS